MEIPYGVLFLKSGENVISGDLYFKGLKKYDKGYREIVQSYGIKELGYDSNNRRMHILAGISVLEDLTKKDFVKEINLFKG